uniref:Integrase catalytic domain-containing protein n=1 Tax=Tanacetum cinerariifolium TaxID=118510 RepID=A0A699H2L2_TANCI|nr:hypothetical protein [Tanacetum cinerariifolium]
MEVKLTMSTSYHPQTDGPTKVVNRCLECYLRCVTEEQPKYWMKWLSLAEWWYNSNHHVAINTTPYEIVYGQSPPVHVPYVGGESKVELVDRSLKARDEAVDVFEDWVYLKLKPHRQDTIRKSKQHKLSPKYYGHFQIMASVGQVAYKLQLPDSSQIHDVFHISQLKKCKGVVTHSGSLHAFDIPGVIRVEPLAILERRLAKKGNVDVVYVLVQWTNGSREEATWEPIEEIHKNFPSFRDTNWAFDPLPNYTMGSLSDESTQTYEKKIMDLTKELDVFRYECDDLKSKYINACSSFHQVSTELEMLKQREANTVLHSDEFDQKMAKVQNVLIEQGRELGRRESGGLSLSMASGENHAELDPAMLEKVEKAMAEMKKESWGCLDEIIYAPELSTSVLHFILRSTNGGGSSSGAV